MKEEETRDLVALLAQKTLERFEALESRVNQLETSTNLQGWLLGLGERGYNERFTTEYMRLFQIINDFYTIKKDAWNYNDLLFMRKAIRTVGLNPNRKLSLNTFIDSLTDEILSERVGFSMYQEAICKNQQPGISNYSAFVIEEISSPVFVGIHGLLMNFTSERGTVEVLRSRLAGSLSEALKEVLHFKIADMGVDLNYEFSLGETAIEILGCIRLTNMLAAIGSTNAEDESTTPMWNKFNFFPKGKKNCLRDIN